MRWRNLSFPRLPAARSASLIRALIEAPRAAIAALHPSIPISVRFGSTNCGNRGSADVYRWDESLGARYGGGGGRREQGGRQRDVNASLINFRGWQSFPLISAGPSPSEIVRAGSGVESESGANQPGETPTPDKRNRQENERTIPVKRKKKERTHKRTPSPFFCLFGSKLDS